MITIPKDASHDVQVAFRELDAEVSRLKAKPAVDTDSIDREIDKLKRAIDELSKRPQTQDFNDVFRASGPQHGIGLVPDPGVTADFKNFLREDSTFNTPFDIGVLGTGSGPLDQDTQYVYAHPGTAVGLNTKWLSGNMVHSIGFSSGQYFSTTGAALTSYDYTAAADFLRVGDVIHIWGKAVLQGTTAGTKSLTMAIGTATPYTVFSSTTVTVNSLFEFHLMATVRSTTGIGIGGPTFIAPNATAPTLYYSNNLQTVADVSANSQLVRMVGTHTGSSAEMRMTDYFIIIYRAGGNFTLV